VGCNNNGRILLANPEVLQFLYHTCLLGRRRILDKPTQETPALEHRSWVGCERGPFGLFSQPPAEPDRILVASSGSPVSLFR
jgi:hypothetical protein